MLATASIAAGRATVKIGRQLQSIVLVTVVLVAMLGRWLWTPDRARTPLEAKYANTPDDFVQVAGLRPHLRD